MEELLGHPSFPNSVSRSPGKKRSFKTTAFPNRVWERGRRRSEANRDSATNAVVGDDLKRGVIDQDGKVDRDLGADSSNRRD